jgi:hypothetical protein
MAPRQKNPDNVKKLLEQSRAEFRSHLLLETAMMASSLVPEHRTAARKILGVGDFPGAEILLDRDTLKRIKSVRKVIEGDNKITDAFAREIIKDEEVDNEELKKKAAKLVNTSSVAMIRRHVSNPWRGPKEKELLEALESLDERVIAPMKDDLEQLAEKSPYESVKRAAMALLARSYGSD